MTGLASTNPSKRLIEADIACEIPVTIMRPRFLRVRRFRSHKSGHGTGVVPTWAAADYRCGTTRNADPKKARNVDLLLRFTVPGMLSMGLSTLVGPSWQWEVEDPFRHPPLNPRKVRSFVKNKSPPQKCSTNSQFHSIINIISSSCSLSCSVMHWLCIM